MDETVNDADIIESLEPIQDSVANEPEQVETQENDSSAVEEASEQSTSEQTANDEPADSTSQTGDANISEFLAKKGIDPNDPEALSKVAEMYQNVEKGFYQKSQEKARLERQLSAQTLKEQDPINELRSEVNSMRVANEANDWKLSHNISPEVEQKMIEVINSPVTDRFGNPQTTYDGQAITKGNLVLNGVLSLDDVYRLAGGERIEAEALRDNMQKALQSEMVAKQSAKRPSANATNSTQFASPEADDPFLAGFMGD